MCLYSAVNMRNDSCELGCQIQGRMMFYSKCWECGSWSLLGTICSWWLTIMGKWFYCFHIRQEKWYLCMSLKKGCCWASSSSFVMYLLRIILALYNFRSFMKESGSIVIGLHGMSEVFPNRALAEVLTISSPSPFLCLVPSEWDYGGAAPQKL